MDVYKSPDSDVDMNSGNKFKPVKAILLGLLISVILVMIVSVIESIVFAIALGADLTNESSLNEVLTNSKLFLVTDLVLTALILFFAGVVVRKYTPNKEVLFGLILSSLTLAIYLPLALSSNTFSDYPLWYNILTLIIIYAAVFMGAKPRR